MKRRKSVTENTPKSSLDGQAIHVAFQLAFSKCTVEQLYGEVNGPLRVRTSAVTPG